jgi:hypothetical protein
MIARLRSAASSAGLALLLARTLAAETAPPPVLDVQPAALPPEVVAELTLAEGSRLVSHARTGVYAALWNDAALERVRGSCAEQADAIAASLHLDPRSVLPVCGPLRLELLGFSAGGKAGAGGNPQPLMRGTVAIRDLAAPLLALAARRMAATTLDLADQALTAPWGADGRAVLARYGDQLVASLGSAPVRLPEAQAPTTDASLRVDLPGLIAAWQHPGPPAGASQAAAPQLEYQLTIVPEGVRERLAWHQPVAGLLPVDRKVLAPLPASTLLVLAVGVDGPAAWERYGHGWVRWLAAHLAPGGDPGPDGGEQQIDNLLSLAGIPLSASKLVQSLAGTVVVAIGQGVPLPTVTIALPRTPMLDQAVEGVLKQLQVEMPAEGTSTLLPLSTLPVALNLIRDVHHWVVSTDADVTTGWPNGDVGGWARSLSGRLALEQAPADAVVIGSSDTALVLRTCSGLLALAAQRHAKELDDQQRLLLQLPLRLAAIASPGYLSATNRPEGLVATSRGTLGWIGLPAVTALFGYELRKLQNARLAIDEAKAIDRLAHGILPAELQFQARCRIDQDGNHVGEFGLLSELGGFRPVPGGAAGAAMLPVDLASGSLDGWHYTVFLPDAAGGAFGEPDGLDARTADPKAARAQEHHWVAYAWPEPGTAGKRLFAILPDGVVRSAPFDGDAPDWGDVFGGDAAGWDAPPTWSAVEPAPASR